MNRELAERFWPLEGALGQLVEVGGRPVRIVGVVDNSRTVIQDDQPTPLIYLPVTQVPSRRMAVVMRSSADAGACSSRFSGFAT